MKPTPPEEIKSDGVASSTVSQTTSVQEDARHPESVLGMTVHSLPLQTDTAGFDNKRRWRGRWVLIGLLLICALPLLASYFTYYVLRPDGTGVNYGELIIPQRPLPQVEVTSALESSTGWRSLTDLRGQWLLLSVSSGDCGAECERNLYLQRQLREALGRDMHRVDWVWLVEDDVPIFAALRPALQQAVVLRVPQEAVRQWLPDVSVGADSGVYVVDPMGNLMMHFASGFAPKKALKDLQRLLRASASWDVAGRPQQ